MKQTDVTELLAQSAWYAHDATQDRPHVDIKAVVSLARERSLRDTSIGRRVMVAAATVAALAVIAFVSVVMIGRQSSPDTPIPESLVFLVDSLYPETDYIIDEVSPYFTDIDGFNGALSDGGQTGTVGFLDSVWDQVLDQTGD